MFDLISVGDALIDTLVPVDEAKVMRLDGQDMLCLRYGDKIPVGASVSLVAGNAANSAVGAARLKLKSAIYVNVGTDSNGKKIKDKLKDEGVNINYVAENKEYPTNHHIVLDFKGERTILIYHQPWHYQLPDLDLTKWVYLTSISAAFVKSNLVSQIINYLGRTGAKLLYNPGTFQIKLGVKKFPELLTLTEVFIVNLEEAKLILSYKESDNIPVKKLLRGICDLGPKRAIITDADKGSYGFDGEKFYNLGIFPAKLLEMTGAGDAYATGVLAGLFYGNDLSQAMRWGTANGAAVVEEVGPQAGLLTYDKMQEKLKENSKIVVKELT